ncbi:MAG: Sensor protein QseC [Burkholderia sp.]|jgi:two-component system, OmpR family, sensor kinase
MPSIRRRLLFTLIGALLAAGILTAAATFFTAKSEFSRFLDTHMKETADFMARALADGRTPSDDTPSISGEDPSYQIEVQVYDSSCNKLWRRQGRPKLPLPEKPGFALDELDGHTWRTYSVTSGAMIITVGQDASVRTQLAASAAFRIMQPLFLLLPFIAIAVWILLGSGLAPLEKMARSVARRSPVSLEPISTQGMPSELAGLVNSVNSLMARLKDSLAAQQRFASDAAHELRTPLTAIKLQLQLAQRAKTDEARNKALSRLNDGITRATRLVQQLLTLARLDPDSSKKPVSTVRLDELAQSVCEDMEPIAAQKDIRITACAQFAATEGMEDAIRLMMTNLTDNAVRYTPEGGRIEIRTRMEDGSAVIEVCDSGPGIPPAERSRVFDRFYRALGTKTQGTGLGLAIVKRIIDIHRGTIAIDDGLDGRGTTFRIRLPRLGAAQPPSAGEN